MFEFRSLNSPNWTVCCGAILQLKCFSQRRRQQVSKLERQELTYHLPIRPLTFLPSFKPLPSEARKLVRCVTKPVDRLKAILFQNKPIQSIHHQMVVWLILGRTHTAPVENESRSFRVQFIDLFTLWNPESKGDKTPFRGFAFINNFAGLFKCTTVYPHLFGWCCLSLLAL